MKKNKEVTVTKEQLAVLDAAAMYFNMVNCDTIFDVTYGDHHVGGYKEEKVAKMYKGGFAATWSMLDGYHRNRLATAILSEYYKECIDSYTEE